MENSLEKWEVAIVKAMLERGGYNDQDIQAYFTRPSRSINHARILEIRKGNKHKAAKAVTPESSMIFLKLGRIATRKRASACVATNCWSRRARR